MTDATDRAKQLLSTLDRENAVAFTSVRGVLRECIAEIERLNKQIASMNHAAHAYDGEVERLRAALEEVLGDYEAYESRGDCSGIYDVPVHDVEIVKRAREALKDD